jgi:hypothetical protein
MKGKSMRKATIFTFALSFALVISLTVPVTKSGYVSAQNSTRQVKQLTPEQIKELKARSRVIEKVRHMLLSHNVPFDPYLLFTNNWKAKVSPAFEQMPEMYENRVVPLTKIRGLGMANELTLPEQITLTGDTVILARKVKFDGQHIKITGPYDFHLFVTESVETTKKNGSITINLNGAGYQEWQESHKNTRPVSQKENKQPLFINAGYTPLLSLPQSADGAPGAPGDPGAPGGNGSNGGGGSNGGAGNCLNTNGHPGGWGSAGSSGTAGGDGGTGGNGGAAGNGTITISSPTDTTPYYVSAKGGDGGPGGAGGIGGNGGNGGPGGHGGNGAGCSCAPGGVGDGGDGGDGGDAGSGGHGGDGGHGGNGGSGGSVTIHYPTGYNTGYVSWSTAGGAAGPAGAAGYGGAPGVAGSGGAPGAGGSRFECNGTSGTSGSDGSGGTTGGGGDGGGGGSAGSNGSNPVYDPVGGGGGGTLEPGGFGEGCTDWYYVEFWCIPIEDRSSPSDDRSNPLVPKKTNFIKTSFIPTSASLFLTDYNCVEIGRTYAGCW